MLSEPLRRSLEAAVSEAEAALDVEAVEYLRGRGLAKETARTFRLGCVRAGEYANRLTIPYLSADGEVVDVRYRNLTSEGPKYLSRPGAPTRLFNVSALLADSSTIWVTEGEIDAITLTQVGLPAVGVPGAKTWQKHWSRLFLDFDQIIVVCDGDQAGHDFGRKFMEKIENASVLHLPDGEDANSVYTTSGADELKGLVNA